MANSNRTRVSHRLRYWDAKVRNLRLLVVFTDGTDQRRIQIYGLGRGAWRGGVSSPSSPRLLSRLLPLEVGPLIQLGDLGERCKLPQQPKSNMVHFSLKIWHLVATIQTFMLMFAEFSGGEGAGSAPSKYASADTSLVWSTRKVHVFRCWVWRLVSKNYGLWDKTAWFYEHLFPNGASLRRTTGQTDRLTDDAACS